MTEPKRICLIVGNLAKRSGGAERVLIELANEMAARGHSVEIVHHEDKRGMPFYPLAEGVGLKNLRPYASDRALPRRAVDKARRKFHRMRLHRPGLDRLSWLSLHGGFWRRLQAHLEATRPDVAVAFLPPAITALALADPPTGIRRVGSLHNLPSMDYDSPERWDPNPRDRRIRRDALARMDALTVLLPEFRDWFAPEMRPRVHVVPNVIRPADTAADVTRARTVLAVGRLAAVKRHDILLRAWADLSKTFPDWSLKIFGRGPLQKSLDALTDELGIADHVELGVHTDTISDEYADAAILAHPADYEGFGLAVGEALAHAVPAVAFADCPGANTLIQDGVNGRLVDPGADRTAAFREALGELMANVELRARLSAAGPGSMAQYAPKAVYDLWENLLCAGEQHAGGNPE
ncbi:MAG: glycosyltransferase [Maritimibacter sp.]|nr:glycosyltransferase [Maritimibacter sp.]